MSYKLSVTDKLNEGVIMKALLSLTLVTGLLISSNSNAFCLKQFSKQQNRFAASLAKTNYQPGGVKNVASDNTVVKPGAARK
jgi:hypothetical protein